ncbi:MAG: CpaD family pilus assembly lipoprotein [Bdellovibrionales bacterium]
MALQRFLVISAGVVMSGFLLQGCESIVHSETQLAQKKMQLESNEVVETVSVDDMDSHAIAALSDHYSRQGNGKVQLTITYDPKSSGNTAMNASNHAARIGGEFRKNGVDVDAMILPIKGLGDDAQAIVSFNSLSLAGPDCDLLPGLENRNVDTDAEYELGCSRDTIMAKQIARPRDLVDDNEPNSVDGRRASNIVERYRTGEPNEPLNGQEASDQ